MFSFPVCNYPLVLWVWYRMDYWKCTPKIGACGSCWENVAEGGSDNYTLAFAYSQWIVHLHCRHKGQSVWNLFPIQLLTYHGKIPSDLFLREVQSILLTSLSVRQIFLEKLFLEPSSELNILTVSKHIKQYLKDWAIKDILFVFLFLIIIIICVCDLDVWILAMLEVVVTLYQPEQFVT